MQREKIPVREVTIAEILDARERRARLQSDLIEKYGSTLISFTMNIAGPIKRTPLVERAFEYGMKRLCSVLPEDKLLFRSVSADAAGCEAMLAVDLDAEYVKRICVDIEEENRLGRLFDMDVIDKNGKKLDREVERSCIVCNKKGRECSAGRIHSADRLVKVTNNIITEHFADADAENIGRLAVDCLVREVETTPKPGLVDLKNNGSHSDMTVDTFVRSATSLKKYFSECVRIGIETKSLDGADTFGKLRGAGIIAEKDMLCATGGVNTHKGAIYSFGVLLGALGRLWQADDPIAEREVLLSEVSSLVKASLESDLTSFSGKTAGERLYIERGLTGIRGEVASGFSSVTRYALPVYCSELENGSNKNDAGVRALISLISALDDTNLYNRGGVEGMDYAKDYAKGLIARGFDVSDVTEMDEAFIKRRLSPGGSADLLAVTYLLYELEKYAK